jgi:hypothetical protein
LGGNYTIYLQNGKKKLDVNSIFGENCMIFGEAVIGHSSAIEGKKAL